MNKNILFLSLLFLFGCTLESNKLTTDNTNPKKTDSISSTPKKVEIQRINTSTIDPTGTYKLQSHTEKRGEDLYGYFGEIKVKRLNENQILLSLDVCSGAPAYNSGGVGDTLDYNYNKAIYICRPIYDSTCRITFDFTKKGVAVVQKSEESSFPCGFGHCVSADGFYKMISKKVPEVKVLKDVDDL